MIKNILIGIFAAIIIIAVGASAYNAFASPDTTAAVASNPSAPNSSGKGPGSESGVQLTAIPPSDLGAEEAADLLFMREEEKLARDVYNQMFALWGQQVFQNIAASEQVHMDQIKLLMDRYGLADPALAAGQFTDPNLQTLYDQLIAQGSASLDEARKVGAAVEQVDIDDLQTRLARTDNADIQLVYNNLMNASYNHLAAFTGQAGNGQGQGAGQGQGGNGQGQGTGQGQGSGGLGQANIAGATTVHGIINSFDGAGLSITTDDGQPLYVQLGNSRYVQSLGLAPQTGEGVTINGFTGDQGMYTAITITLDSTGQVYTFRSATGRPMWAGGNGGNH